MKNQDYLKEIEQIEKESVEVQKAFYKKKLGEEEEKTKVRVLYCYHYARLFYQDGDFRKTTEILEPVILDYQSYPYTPEMILCFNLMGMVTYCETEYSVSRYYFGVALRIADDNDAKFYYSFEYNDIATSYIQEKDYEAALKNIQLAEKYLKYCDEEMGTYIYVNKSTLFQKMNRMEEALQTYDNLVNKYRGFELLPDDTRLCAATLFYKLGEREKYEDFKQQILLKIDELPAMEFMDTCKELFECGLDSGDDALIEKILSSMDQYMESHPKEIKVGITVADLKYIYAGKQGDKDAVLAALEKKDYYKDQIIAISQNKRVQSLYESMDINEQLQKAIESKDRAAMAKSQFLANMSHDIRTPINGIMGMLNIIRRSGDNPRRIKDSLDKIEVSSKLLLSLVNDVLDMTKLETDAIVLNNESINLDQVCEEATEAVSFQAEEAGLRITVEHDDFSGINVFSSSLHLKKILINLFSNSIKYNKPGGAIHTSMRMKERTEDRIVCEFKIADTGVGMSEDFIANKLFKPFVQADNSSRSSYAGTGLGMSIVKQLVEKMGGSITVESKLGEGSCFTVVLPFELDNQKTSVNEEDNVDTDITGMRFLVAEDNDLNMEIIEFLLTDRGAQVVPAKNGKEALDKFESAEKGTFNAVLMDLMMPVMNGLEATKKIRASSHPEAKTIPIIAMTANAFAEDEERCLAAGMNAHLAKPLDMKKVVSTIGKFCHIV